MAAVAAGEPESHVSPGHEDVQGHHAAKLQRKAFSDSAVALDAKFYAYGEELETAFRCNLAACMALHVFVAW